MRGLCVADRQVRAGLWPRNGGSYTLGRDVSGSRVGILGLGGIGSAIAARLVGFDCAIGYHNRRQVPGSPYRYAASPVELAESVDVLMVAAAGGAGTENLVSRAVLEALGPDGYVINIARGSVVDQDALVELLVGAGWQAPGWMCSPMNLMYQRNCADWTMSCYHPIWAVRQFGHSSRPGSWCCGMSTST
jgi:lactate dehydrogenase-like 2-hydroxyacid dehydrogenase